MIPPANISLWTNKVSLKERLKFTSISTSWPCSVQVGSIFCSRLELLLRTVAGNRAYVSGHHNTTSRRTHTWFLFISQWTLRETSWIFAWKFASNFRVDWINARKFVAYYRTPRTNNRCHKKSTKNRELSKRFLFKRNIIKKPWKARISLKFVCITFSQYCKVSFHFKKFDTWRSLCRPKFSLSPCQW